MLLKDVMQALDYKVQDTSEYLWKCYGENARYMDFKSDYASVFILFDTETHIVYEATIEAADMKSHIGPYRWINPDYTDAVFNEARSRGIDNNKAWDNIEWINLDLSEDFLTKASAIFNGRPYDKRILVNIELPDETWMQLSLQAHEKGITMNAMMNHVLRSEIRRRERELRTK